MATAKKKSSATRTTAKKKTTAKTARKGAKTSAAKTAGKAAPAKSAKRSAASKKKPKAVKRPARRDLLAAEGALTGTLTVSNGVLGVSTEAGFFTLDRLADGGENVGVVFQLGPQRTVEMTEALRGLVEFVESHSAEAIGVIVRCCISP
jgi:predicted flap endonuclease-1-like 5' DNA nuclease